MDSYLSSVKNHVAHPLLLKRQLLVNQVFQDSETLDSLIKIRRLIDNENNPSLTSYFENLRRTCNPKVFEKIEQLYQKLIDDLDIGKKICQFKSKVNQFETIICNLRLTKLKNIMACFNLNFKLEHNSKNLPKKNIDLSKSLSNLNRTISSKIIMNNIHKLLLLKYKPILQNNTLVVHFEQIKSLWKEINLKYQIEHCQKKISSSALAAKLGTAHAESARLSKQVSLKNY